MSLIRKPYELTIQPKIKMLIYGAAGIGKTTLALSAPKPLLLDFDGGVNRVNYAFIKDTVQINSYEECLEVLNTENLSPYETIVIDTGGKCLDRIAEYEMKKDTKNRRRNGQPSQQGYGAIKVDFSSLCKLINGKEKNVIFVAHRKTIMDGEDNRYVPLFGGSNYDSLITELDLVGYMESVNNKRTITFDPTDRHDGKNTCYMKAIDEIPSIIDKDGNPSGENNYLTEKVIKPYYICLQNKAEMAKKYDEVMDEIKDQIAVITDADSANDFISRIDRFHHVGSSKAMASRLLAQKAKALHLTLNKETKLYEQPAA